MKIVIVSGGSPPSYELITKELKDSSYLICADSGGNCLYDYNIIPDYLIGDFDSILPEALTYFKNSQCTVETYPKYKDFTDTELAMIKAMDLKAEEVVFLGCTGSRIDHTLGNLGLLRKCLDSKVAASIKDDNNSIYIYDKCTKITGEEGQTFSLQAYCDMVENLTITGAKYPLTNYDLKLGDPLTLSNEFFSNIVDIKFDNGVLLVIFSVD